MKVVYINKSRMSFNRSGERNKVEELEMVEIPVKYDRRLVRVLISHGRDLLIKLNGGVEGMNLEESIEKLKRYYRSEGLETEEIEKENFSGWMCEYCRYRDMCMERERIKEENGVEMEV